MALHFKPGKYDTPVDPDTLTEQEHKDSCDINKMIRASARGHDVRGAKIGDYGYDDTNMTGLQFRMEKQRLEEELGKTAATHEFDEEELKHIPEHIQKKFGFKKKAKKQAKKNDESNDDNPGPKKTPKSKAKETDSDLDDGQES